MLRELALGLAVFAGTSACRGRDDRWRACPPTGVLDASLSLAYVDLAGTADEAWAVGVRRVAGSDLGQVLLRWDGCEWKVVRSQLDDGPVNGVSAIAAVGGDVWLAANRRGIGDGRTEVFGPNGRIYSVPAEGGPRCLSDGRILRRHGNDWDEVKSPKPNAQIALPGDENAREPWALAAGWPDDVWMLDRNCGRGYLSGYRPGDVNLVRWNGKEFTTVEVEPSLGQPRGLSMVVSRAWPWSETVRTLWLVASKGIGRWDGRGWSWFPVAEQDSVYRLAGGGPSDLWAFGLAAWHWDGTRWSPVYRPAGADPKLGAPVFMWAGAVAGGHTFALDSTGDVFRGSDSRLASIGRVRGRVTGLAVGSDELWLWALAVLERPVLRWKAGRWDVSPAARGAGVTLESDSESVTR